MGLFSRTLSSVAVTWVVACGIDLRGTGEDVDASDDNAADAHDADSDAGLVDGPRDSPSIDAPAALSAGSCEAARKGGINSDGERQLYLGGDQAKPFMGYCVGMATGTARTYLTLVLASDGANTSTYDATRLGATTVVTQWTRLAFDPDTLLVDTADFAFATSKGSVNHPNETPGGLVVTRVPYGVARDCAAPSSTLGTANIDLTGLPFEVDLAATKWGSDGAEAAGTMASADARVISVKGGGYCGWHAISSNRFGGKLLVLRYRP